MKEAYTAASLFNGRETGFNVDLAEGLEELDHSIYLPQRDGFEFVKLIEAFDKKLPPEQIFGAVRNVIYYLDMGIFIPESKTVVALLDEPIDEGAIIETTYAKSLGKVIIGVRTDVRSPYGPPGDPYRGLHYFVAKMCNYFISADMSARTPAERKLQMSKLVNKIHEILNSDASLKAMDSGAPKEFDQIQLDAQILFHDLPGDIHSPESLDLIARRYVENREYFEKNSPKLITL